MIICSIKSASAPGRESERSKGKLIAEGHSPVVVGMSGLKKRADHTLISSGCTGDYTTLTEQPSLQQFLQLSSSVKYCTSALTIVCHGHHLDKCHTEPGRSARYIAWPCASVSFSNMSASRCLRIFQNNRQFECIGHNSLAVYPCIS